MRKTRKGKVDNRVMSVVARNYVKLRDLCISEVHGTYAGEDYEDIFQNTILYIVQDKDASALLADEDIIKHFLYRFNMIKYQTIQDNKMMRSVDYADYKQNKEEEASDRQ